MVLVEKLMIDLIYTASFEFSKTKKPMERRKDGYEFSSTNNIPLKYYPPSS